MEHSRFPVTEQEGTVRGTYVLVDQETGVNYLFVKFGNAGGLTPLLNPGRYARWSRSPFPARTADQTNTDRQAKLLARSAVLPGNFSDCRGSLVVLPQVWWPQSWP